MQCPSTALVIVLLSGNDFMAYTSNLPTTVAASLRHEPSSPARTLGSRVRIQLEAWMSVCVYSVCVVLCVGSGLATG
jgi:hypothetical protein